MSMPPDTPNFWRDPRVTRAFAASWVRLSKNSDKNINFEVLDTFTGAVPFIDVPHIITTWKPDRFHRIGMGAVFLGTSPDPFSKVTTSGDFVELFLPNHLTDMAGSRPGILGFLLDDAVYTWQPPAISLATSSFGSKEIMALSDGESVQDLGDGHSYSRYTILLSNTAGIASVNLHFSFYANGSPPPIFHGQPTPGNTIHNS
jgi:hypothetical protein